MLNGVQVVTLAVYTYFAAALMGAQWVQPLSAEDYVTITKLPAFSDVGEDSNNATAADGDGLAYQGGRDLNYLDCIGPLCNIRDQGCVTIFSQHEAFLFSAARPLRAALPRPPVRLLRRVAQSSGDAHQSLRGGRRRLRAQLPHRQAHQGGSLEMLQVQFG